MRPQLVCLDIDGTLSRGIGGELIAGARDAVHAARRLCAVRLVTNATSRSHAQLADWLGASGLLERKEELITPATTARRVLTERGHTAGLLIADRDALGDFDWFTPDPDGAVVVLASEAHSLRIAELQSAFRALLAGAHFYTLQRNRYFRSAANELVTDLGAVAAFLSYASGREAENLGKPAAAVFDSLARELDISREEIVMVGDDAEFDVAGPIALGLTGVLVRTGKYQPGDESRHTPAPHTVLDSVADLDAWLSSHTSKPCSDDDRW